VVAYAVSLAVITYLDRVCISFAAPSIRRDLGLTPVQMGLAFSAFNIGYALFEIPGGFLGDWIGPRKVLTRIVLWWSFFTAATGWAWGQVSLVATRFLFGAGEAGCFPNLSKAFTVWLTEREQVRAQGAMWLAARWGGAFTPPLVALVIKLVGWRHGFAIFGCVGLVWAAIFWFRFRDDPRQHPKMNDAERELLRDNAALAASHSDVPWGKIVRSRQVWMLCWQFFAMNYGWWFNVTWLPTYLREARHVEIVATAWLSVLPLFLGGLGNPVSVFLTTRLENWTKDRRRARRDTARLGLIGAGAFLFFSTWMHSPLAAMLFIGMSSFCNDLVMPPAWNSATDIGGPWAGTVGGAMNMWGNLGGAISPTAIGLILRWTGSWNVTFYASAAAYLTAVVFWSFLDPVTPLVQSTDAGVHAEGSAAQSGSLQQ
jgi:MFS family permease